MAIKSYHCNLDNNKRFEVYVNLRSKSGFRMQKRHKGLKTLVEAKRKVRELIRNCALDMKAKEEQGLTFNQVLVQWELYFKKYKSQDLNSITRGDYIGSLHKHCSAWLTKPAKAIVKLDVMEVLNQMITNGYSQSYQNKMKVMIHRIFIFSIEHGLVDLKQSPAYGIRLQREEKKKPEILTKSQIQLLLQSAKGIEHPWYCVWATALLTGMRNGELYTLLWKDINW